ncbi:MAG: sensor histidine kinase [Nocardioidaceae bacterium]
MEPTTAALAPPPLTRWQLIWRNLVVIVVGGLLWLSVAPLQWSDHRPLFWVDLTLGLCGLALYQLRRRAPAQVVPIVIACSALSASASGAAALALISLATRRRWSEMLPAGAVNIAAGLVFFEVEPQGGDPIPWYLTLAINALATGVAIAIGMYCGARRELIATLKDRAERAEREQAMRVGQARLSERASIAREMHDALAHRMSLVAMHAGALSFRSADLSRSEAAEAADVIQGNANRALRDLREILGLLRAGEGSDVPERPQPTMQDIPVLVDEAHRSGMHVQLFSSVESADDVPDSVGRNAYRMVQEGLTNARKHAPDTTVEVTLSGSARDGLTVDVRNRLRVGTRVVNVPGAGLGLVGLAERAALSGGRLEHGSTDDGDFEVRAWLPWPS